MSNQQSQADYQNKVKNNFFLAVKLWMWCKNVKYSERLNEAAKAYVESNAHLKEEYEKAKKESKEKHDKKVPIYPMEDAAIFFTEFEFYRHYAVAVNHGESVLKELDKESAWLFEIEKSKDCYDCE